MSGKLDQSLDEILSTQRKGAGNNRRSARRPVARPTTAAPVGGVRKSAKPARGAAAKPTPAKASGAVGESKIQVSNLVCNCHVAQTAILERLLINWQPRDVSESQIKVCCR
jgi:THO complex subunit 4